MKFMTLGHFDMSAPPIPAPSPNFDVRKSPPDMLILHYTGMESGEAALERLRDPVAKVSSHYLIETDGRVFTLVAEERRAWHAGVSFWRGETDINARSIGIELVNPGHEHGYMPFPDVQIGALIDVLDGIRSRWGIADGDILGHSDVAPNRKIDPGELFPWKRLAHAGHGLWAEPNAAPGAALGPGDSGMGVFVIQAGLTRFGYNNAPTGEFDANTITNVKAFQRHWRPEDVDGIADGETRARLIGLLRMRG